jgi:hypothetical protein
MLLKSHIILKCKDLVYKWEQLMNMSDYFTPNKTFKIFTKF